MLLGDEGFLLCMLQSRNNVERIGCNDPRRMNCVTEVETAQLSVPDCPPEKLPAS